MTDIQRLIHIKQELARIEQTNNWRQAAEYLATRWRENRDDGALCMLLIEEMMNFLIEIDNGCSLDLHMHDNGNPDNRAFFQALLDEAKAYGIRYRLWAHSKYFLWRLCYYLAYYSTYYPILGGDIGEPHGALCWYLRCAEEQEPQSVLLSMIRKGLCTHAWTALSPAEIASAWEELDSFQLQQNWVDDDILYLLELSLGPDPRTP